MMEQMGEGMGQMGEGMHGTWMMSAPLILVLVLIAAAVAVVVFFARQAPQKRLPVTSFDKGGAGGRLHRRAAALIRGSRHEAAEVRDLVFVLPDISHYTRFMTVNRFAFGHAQHIVFQLINAMIDAAAESLDLSKIEGDAALFYADPAHVGPDEIGRAVMAIFEAFFRTQNRLLASNICPCSACTHILDLDLKVLVHGGEASAYEFRGAVDFFGMDMIVLHRLLKNTVRSHRYIIVTQAAADLCRLPVALPSRTISETIEHVGAVPATVYDLDDALVERMRTSGAVAPVSAFRETAAKIAHNAGTLRDAVLRRRHHSPAE